MRSTSMAGRDPAQLPSVGLPVVILRFHTPLEFESGRWGEMGLMECSETNEGVQPTGVPKADTFSVLLLAPSGA
jgi:hypothetical protein